MLHGSQHLIGFGVANDVFVFNDTISTHTAGYDIATQATSAGWDGVTPLLASITINSTIYVYSTSTSSPSFVTGTYPSSSLVTLTNNGLIVGKGGLGGGANGAGGGGGLALYATSPISIDNTSGTIGGGGGGGGGAGGYYGRTTTECGYFYSGGGGGGGGRSYSGTAGGAGGGNSGGLCTTVNGSTGGTSSSAAAGGGGSYGYSYLKDSSDPCNDKSPCPGCTGSCNASYTYGGTGGAGGSWGAAGASGGNGGCTSCPGGSGTWYSGQAGGAGGACTSGSATYITWIATGTRYGTVG